MKKNVLYIGNALSKHGKTVSTIEILGEHLQEFCHVVIVSSKRNKMARLVDMVVTLWKYRKKTDIVIIDTYSTTNFYYALVISQLCRLIKKPYITILHGGNLERRLQDNPKMSALVFHHAKAMVAPSHYLKKVFATFGFHNVTYIPNPIEIANYTYRERPLETIKILWVRSFAKIYNPMLAILTLEKLIGLGQEAELIMVGPDKDGILAECKAAAKEKGLKVRFTGLLNKSDWIGLAQKANVFINTTNVDNTPMSVIEAMALGLPIVTTNVGGIKFLVNHEVDGLLVPPNDENLMADAILKLKFNPSERELQVRTARHKVSQFDWKAVKPKWQKLLS